MIRKKDLLERIEQLELDILYLVDDIVGIKVQHINEEIEQMNKVKKVKKVKKPQTATEAKAIKEKSNGSKR